MKLSYYLICIGIIVVLAFVIGLKSCRAPKEDPVILTPTMEQVDSLNEKERRVHDLVDSLSVIASRNATQRDSLRKVVDRQSEVIAVKTLTVKALGREAELYKKYADQPSYVLACDSLLPQVGELTDLVEHYRHDNQVLLNRIDSVADANSLIGAQREYFNGEMRHSLTEVSKIALQLEKNNIVLRRQNRRHWAITAMGGYLFDGQRWRYGAGIGVGRIIAKF